MLRFQLFYFLYFAKKKVGMAGGTYLVSYGSVFVCPLYGQAFHFFLYETTKPFDNLLFLNQSRIDLYKMSVFVSIGSLRCPPYQIIVVI